MRTMLFHGRELVDTLIDWWYRPHQMDRIERAIFNLGRQMANDYTELSQELEGIRAVALETKTTLVALVELILSAPPSDQPAINALRDRAREIKEELAAAEDEADNVLPVVEQPPVE
jgi:hypothetical protein